MPPCYPNFCRYHRYFAAPYWLPPRVVHLSVLPSLLNWRGCANKKKKKNSKKSIDMRSVPDLNDVRMATLQLTRWQHNYHLKARCSNPRKLFTTAVLESRNHQSVWLSLVQRPDLLRVRNWKTKTSHKTQSTPIAHTHGYILLQKLRHVQQHINKQLVGNS